MVEGVTSAKDGDPPRWRVYGERTVYDNPWVKLVRVDVAPSAGERFEHDVVRLSVWLWHW
jgi:8-oxo-dGDP phosphatase